MGVTGVFTKALDIALLNDEIDLAFHCLKDVPYLYPEGISSCAVFERESPFDVLILSDKAKKETKESLRIGTGSLRRQHQWSLHRPQDSVVNLRGNVGTRLEKLTSGELDGIILAQAGLDRMGWVLSSTELLSWMTPSPAQGTLTLACRTDDTATKELFGFLHNKTTALCTEIERSFMHRMEAGCSAPLGAYAHVVDNRVRFAYTYLHGKQTYEDRVGADLHDTEVGIRTADKLKDKIK